MLVKCLLNLLSVLPAAEALTLKDALCDEKGNVNEDSHLCLPVSYTRLHVSNTNKIKLI